MRNRIIAILTLLLSMLTVSAQQPATPQQQQGEAEAASADSVINREAESPTFITASLLVIEPGPQVYSAYGHSAIRLQCPSKGLDFCFSFEMPLSTWSKLSYAFGKAKGGFEAVETQAFIDEYRRNHRGIKAYTINLTPKEKQRLWQVLDEEVSEGFHWDYKLPTINCSNMCQYAVEQALDGGRIVYGKLNPLLTSGTYEDMFRVATKDRPWTRLTYYIFEIGHWHDTGTVEDKLTPVLLAETWQHATFRDNGPRRPVIIGKAQQLVPPMYTTQPTFFTPTVVAVILIVVIIVMIAVIVRYKHNKKTK